MSFLPAKEMVWFVGQGQMQKLVAGTFQFSEVSGRNLAELQASTENSSLAVGHEFSAHSVAEATEFLQDWLPLILRLKAKEPWPKIMQQSFCMQ